MTERFAIVGSRRDAWGRHAWAVQIAIHSLVRALPDGTTVISGESPGGGVDIWAREAARRWGKAFVPFPPRTYERESFLERNAQIAEACDRMVAFVTDGSRGTWHVWKCAKRLGKPVTLLRL